MTIKANALANEKEIGQALYTNLKKSAEESYASETGLVLAEIINAGQLQIFFSLKMIKQLKVQAKKCRIPLS